jgi:hypothetical protein
MDAKSWLLLAYKVPPEPAKKRVALWRRVKSLGAVYVQAGVCLLPKTADHVRRLKIIENGIAEMGGEAVLLETNGLDPLQQDKLRVSTRIATKPTRNFWSAASRLRPKSPGNQRPASSLLRNSRRTRRT